MATRTLAYECKYCGVLKRTRNVCERHELTCLKNVDAKNCILCTHISKVDGISLCDVTGTRCSAAVSANCKYFKRRQGNEQ